MYVLVLFEKALLRGQLLYFFYEKVVFLSHILIFAKCVIFAFYFTELGGFCAFIIFISLFLYFNLALFLF